MNLNDRITSDRHPDIFYPGDSVYLTDTCEVDIGTRAWPYIQEHRNAVVKARWGMPGQPEGQSLYALEFCAEFSGGHDCQGTCLPRRGQVVTRKHLELNFEASRVVNTVPNLQGELYANLDTDLVGRTGTNVD